MPGAGYFKGFSQGTAKFYTELVFNNNREWFDDNRGIYEQEVLTPARLFVVAMGGKSRIHRAGHKRRFQDQQVDFQNQPGHQVQPRQNPL